jgi:hypothetical protein
MPRPVHFAGGAAALLFGWLAWGWLVPSDEARIRAVLDRVAEAIGSDAGDGDLARLGRVAGLRQEFHPDLFVDAGPPFHELRGREAVVAAAARTGGMLRELEISFVDVEIAVGDDRQHASASLVAEARFREGEGAGRAYEARELDVQFVRHEDRWVVSEVVLVGGLKPLR